MNRAVFLDRDNTLIHNDADLGDPAQVKLIQGAASAIASLRGLGYQIVVVSNQGGVARGKYDEAAVEATNRKVNELVKATSGSTIDRFYYCPYHPEGTVERYRREHPWRKPQPGMLLQAAKDLTLDLAQCWMIGDQMRDIQAGAAAGARTVLLSPEAGEQPPLRQEQAAAQLFGREPKGPEAMPDFVARNLIEAVRIVAQQRRPEGFEEARWGNVAAKGRLTPAPTPVAPLRRPGPETPVGRATPPAAASPVLPAPSRAPVRTPAPVTPVTPFTPAPARPIAAAPPLTPAAPAARVGPPAPAGGPATPRSATAPAPAAAPVVSAAAPPLAPPAPPPTSAPAAPPESTLPAAAAPAAASTPAEKPADSGGSGGSGGAARPTTAAPTTDQTLRQILQELRNQRSIGSEFSYTGMIAIILQMIAGVCLLVALFLGARDSATFLHWIGVGLFVQLATIAMLLFRR